MLSTWLLHFSACPAIAATLIQFHLWQSGTLLRTKDPIIAGPDLLYPKNFVFVFLFCEHLITSLIISLLGKLLKKEKEKYIGLEKGPSLQSILE